MRRTGWLALILGLQACTQWSAAPLPSPGLPPATTEFQVWSHHRSYRLRKVTVTRDSLYGLSGSDNTPIALALSGVDSTRVAHRDRGTPIVLAALALVALVAVAYASAVGQGLEGS